MLKFSAVICTYNRYDVLSRAIESLQKQTLLANDPPRAQPANYVNLADDPKFNGGAVPMPTVTGDSLTPGPSITVSPSQGQNISMGPATRPMPVFGR